MRVVWYVIFWVLALALAISYGMFLYHIGTH